MNSGEIPQSGKRFSWQKVVLLLAVVGLVLYLRNQYADQLSLQSLAEQEMAFKEALEANPIVSVMVAFSIYVVVTALSLPAAAALTIVIGWIFGFWQGTLIVSFASTIGATFAFLFSRFLFKDAMLQKFGNRLAKFNQALETEGAFYLFTLRLIPAVPFFIINVVMGLTPLKTRTFYGVSQLGMLPGTMAYVYAGSSVSSLQDIALAAEQGGLFSAVMPPRLVVAFIILAVLPLLMKKLVGFFRNSAQTEPLDQEVKHD